MLLPVLDVLLSPQGFSLLPFQLLGFSILWVGVQIQNTRLEFFLVPNTSLYFSCMRSLAASMASILARYASGSFFIAAASAACSRFSWRSAISQTFHLVNHLPAMKRIYLQVAPSPLEKSIDKSCQGKEDVYLVYHPRSTRPVEEVEKDEEGPRIGEVIESTVPEVLKDESCDSH